MPHARIYTLKCAASAGIATYITAARRRFALSS